MKIYQSPSPTGGIRLMAVRATWEKVAIILAPGLLSSTPEATMIRNHLAATEETVISITCTEEQARVILAVT